MRGTQPPISTPGIAGTLMALVAVAATAAAVPAQGLAPADCRAAVMESHTARAVAAVVAAACDLLGIERSTDTVAPPLPVAAIAFLPQRLPLIEPFADVYSPAPPLRDALLNLPPPIC